MAGITVNIRGDASQFERVMAGVGKRMSGLGSSIAGLTTKSAAFGAAIAAAGASFATWKAIDFIKDASGAAADFESLSMDFETLLKSADKAKAMIAEMKTEAQKSPLSVRDYAQAGKSLLAFGAAGEDIMPTLKMLGDISMGNSERFGSLALAFAQTKAAGRLMGQEVLQFVNAGFNPLQQISEKTGKSMAVLKKEMEDGEISFEMVKQSLKDATSPGGLFFGAIEKGAATTAGKLASLKDNAESLKVAFGTGFNLNLKPVLDNANEFIPLFTQKFADAGKLTGFVFADALTGNFDLISSAGEVLGKQALAGIGTAFNLGLHEVFISAWDKIAKTEDAGGEDPVTKFFSGKIKGYATKRRDELIAGRSSPDATYNEFGDAFGLPDAQQRLKDQIVAAKTNKMDAYTQSEGTNRAVQERWIRQQELKDNLRSAQQALRASATAPATSSGPVALDKATIDALKGVLREVSLPKYTR